MVYQLRDDILDLTATDNQLGKPAGQDLAEGVYSLPTLYALRDSRQAEELSSLLGRPLDDDDRERARKLVVATDGIDRTVLAANRFLADAHRAIARIAEREIASRFHRAHLGAPGGPSALVSLRLEGRKGNDLFDVGLVREDHREAVHPQTQAGRGRRPHSSAMM